MLLVIDIGNTDVTLALFDGEVPVKTGRMSSLSAGAEDFTSGVAEFVDAKTVAGVAIASVVPSLTERLVRACEAVLSASPVVVSSTSDTGLVIRYGTPEMLGVDRLANAVAAWQRCRSAAIVIDFGTTTTFDVVNSKGEYLGGAIFPGLKMSAAALAERTARLPLVDLARPSKVIGDNTEDCIRSALYFGYAGLVDRMVEKIGEELGEEATVLATGGLAELVAGECRGIDGVYPFLTLEGIRIIYSREVAA